MNSQEFFELKATGKSFLLTLKNSYKGFKRGDVLICRETASPVPGRIVILESDDCGRRPMLSDEADAELAAGARIVGQALALSRDLAGEV